MGNSTSPEKIDPRYRNAPSLKRLAASSVVIARLIVVAFVLNQLPRSLCAGHNCQSTSIYPHFVKRNPRITPLLRCQMPIERILMKEGLATDSPMFNQRLIGETFYGTAEPAVPSHSASLDDRLSPQKFSSCMAGRCTPIGRKPSSLFRNFDGSST